MGTPAKGTTSHWTPQYSVEQSQLIVEELLGKGAIVEVHNPRGGFYSNLFLVPKKEERQRPVINLKTLNSFVHTEHFKMEGIHTLRDLVNPDDWLAKVDLKDAYFAIPIHKSHHKYLRFMYQGKHYQPPIWPVIGPLGLYQDLEASASSPPGDWGTTDSIYRRYPCPGGVPGTSKEPCRGGSVPPAMSGFQDKPEKICVRASTSDGIPGLDSRHSPNGVEIPSGQDKEDPCGSHDEGRASLRKSPCSAGWEDECDITRNPTSATLLSSLTDGPGGHTESTFPVLRTGSPYNGVQGGTDVVGHPHDKLEWEVPPQEGGGHDNRFRRLSDRLGSNQSEPEDRPWFKAESRMHINCLELLAATLAVKTFLEKQIQGVSTPQVGQYHGSGIHQQPGRNSLQGTGGHGKEPVDVVPVKEYPHHSPTSTGCPERNSRCGVSDYDRSVRLAAESCDIQQDHTPFRSHRDGFVRISSDGTVPSLFQLATRLTTDAFLQDWSQIKGYANPPWSLIGRVPLKVQMDKARIVLVAPVWKGTPYYCKC